jgi:hypothetical protein
MSLEFAIIPINSTFINTAYDIETKLKENKDNIKLQLNIVIDTNYDIHFTTRINKWKKQVYNIITIDQDYYESNSIIVIFSDKKSTSQTMEIDEFIDLVMSFENEEERNTNDITNSENNIPDDNCIQERECVIM